MSLEPPVRPFRCGNPSCTLPEGGRCARAAEFADPFVQCTDLVRAPRPSATIPEEVPAPAGDGQDAPWSGRHLSEEEAQGLLWSSPARLLTLVGDAGCGKTSLLTSLFLQLANGQRGPFSYRFASSRTLYGFRELTQHADGWQGDAGNAVPRTDRSVSDGNFLHLGLCPESPSDARHIDVLFADLGGERFREVALNAAAQRSLSEFLSRSHVLALLLDAEQLLSPSLVTQRDAMFFLQRLEALTAEATRRPLLQVVFTKFDAVVRAFEGVLPPDGSHVLERAAWGPLGQRPLLWSAIDRARKAFPDFSLRAVSALPTTLGKGQPLGVMDLFAEAMAHADARGPLLPQRPPPPAGPISSFEAMRWSREPV